ncbi:hypothetical protein CLOM_g21125 [Closterium sp. NIES-68]|nr:hypothetical protein CLOM_g21125 [Closterium sp. NIES-68]GJP77073.1 hypothetical protein CLOP_g7506 [Closterium sp. NIES-67]
MPFARSLTTSSGGDGDSDSFAATDTDSSHANAWKELEAMLVCPLSKEPLRFDSTTSEYINDSIGVAYPVVNGIPFLSPHHGRILSSSSKLPTCE